MSEKMIKLSNRADILSLGAHLFCCGIPAFVVILSFVSTISLSGSTLLMQIEHYSEQLHIGAFIFSTLMVVIALGSFFLSRGQDCVKDGHCAHEPCAPKKTKNWKLMGISLGLYAINLIVFLAFSGMHDHALHAH